MQPVQLECNRNEPYDGASVHYALLLTTMSGEGIIVALMLLLIGCGDFPAKRFYDSTTRQY